MKLYQRGEDGYPVGADQLMKDGYGKIPDAEMFQHHRTFGYEVPAEVHGWEWSTTFNRWRALVTFKDGWKGVTSPAPWPRHHNDCPVCKTKLSRHSPNGIDVIYECQNPTGMHHRHIVKGITGEYIRMRPL